MECVPTLNRDAFTGGSKLPQRQSETKVSHSTNSPKVEVSFVKTKSLRLPIFVNRQGAKFAKIAKNISKARVFLLYPLHSCSFVQIRG
jgi:hypothetical protein